LPGISQSRRKRDRFSYLMTKDFWLVMLLGQILALCITGTNTLTTLLVIEGTSIPAFQTFFNYVLLNIIYTSFTIHKYGFRGWAKVLWKDGWKCE
jgi:solute carrier family 35, member F1/2